MDRRKLIIHILNYLQDEHFKNSVQIDLNLGKEVHPIT